MSKPESLKGSVEAGTTTAQLLDDDEIDRLVAEAQAEAEADEEHEEDETE